MLTGAPRLGDDEHLAAALARRLGFEKTHLVERLSDPLREHIGIAALEHLGREASARAEELQREIEGLLDEPDRARLVGVPDARELGRHVRDQAIDAFCPDL